MPENQARLTSFKSLYFFQNIYAKIECITCFELTRLIINIVYLIFMTLNIYLEIGNQIYDDPRLNYIYFSICTDFRRKETGKILDNHFYDNPKDTLLTYIHWKKWFLKATNYKLTLFGYLFIKKIIYNIFQLVFVLLIYVCL